MRRPTGHRKSDNGELARNDIEFTANLKRSWPSGRGIPHGWSIYGVDIVGIEMNPNRRALWNSVQSSSCAASRNDGRSSKRFAFSRFQVPGADVADAFLRERCEAYSRQDVLLTSASDHCEWHTTKVPADSCFVRVEVAVRIKPQQVIWSRITSFEPRQTTDRAQAVAAKHQRCVTNSHGLDHEISDPLIDRNDGLQRSRVGTDQGQRQDDVEVIGVLIQASLELPDKERC